MRKAKVLIEIPAKDNATGESIPKDTVLYLTVPKEEFYSEWCFEDGTWVCDTDSQTAMDYLEIIKDDEEEKGE